MIDTFASPSADRQTALATPPSRRAVLCGALAGAGCAALAAGAGRAADYPVGLPVVPGGADAPGLVSGPAADAPLRATPLADDLLWVTGAGGHVVVGADRQGLVLVDGGRPDRAAELIDFVQRETGESRIHTLINTHWHLDHTGANAALGAAGARIVAHENTRLWMGQDFWVRWQDAEYKAFPAGARPNATFYKTMEIPFGDSVIALAYMPQSHTDGDILVHFPDRNVIVSGGVGATDGWPLLDWGTGGWIIGLMDGLDMLMARADSDTKIVAATGPLVTRSDLEIQRPMFETIQQRIFRLLRQGQSVKDVIHVNPAAEFAEQWGDPDAFLSLTYYGMVMQMRGHRMRIA